MMGEVLDDFMASCCHDGCVFFFMDVDVEYCL